MGQLAPGYAGTSTLTWFVGWICVWLELGLHFWLEIGNWKTNSVHIVADVIDPSIRDVLVRVALSGIKLRDAGMKSLTVDIVDVVNL